MPSQPPAPPPGANAARAAWHPLPKSISPALHGLLAAALLLLASCATTTRTQLLGADGAPVQLRYTMPDHAALDGEIRDALRRFLGEPYEADPAKGAADDDGGQAILVAEIQSAHIEFVPFVYDADSQNREYLGDFTSQSRLWLAGEMIEDWKFRRQRPFSVRPRQHQRHQRLRELRGDLAEWAVKEWLLQLRWQLASRPMASRQGQAPPE